MNQYFIFKVKYNYLPEYIREYINSDKILKEPGTDIYYISKREFRKLKLKNIQNELEDDDKKVIEYLINENFIDFLTEDQFKQLVKRQSWYGMSGISGVSGVSGSSGTFGMSGVLGPTGVTINPNSSYPIITVAI